MEFTCDRQVQGACIQRSIVSSVRVGFRINQRLLNRTERFLVFEKAICEVFLFSVLYVSYVCKEGGRVLMDEAAD